MFQKLKDLNLPVKLVILVIAVLLLYSFTMFYFLSYLLEQKLNGLYPSVRGMMIAQMVARNLANVSLNGGGNIAKNQIRQTLNSYDSYKEYGLSYIIIQDGDNQLIATTLGSDPSPELMAINSLEQGKEIQNKRFKSGDNTIQDVAVPIGEPERPKGIVRVGVLEQPESNTSWEGIKEAKISEVLSPITWGILIGAILIGALLMFFFSKIVVQRVQYLIDVTDKMSFGDLDVNVVSDSKDELGILAETLESMRANLKDAIERLKKRKQA
jgi:methyl-accepting chemotaxis protein